MKSVIVNATISNIDPNPFRMLSEYPYKEKKIETLIHSYQDVGMWPGVIARKKGRGYEIAFGHHRLEAAHRIGLKRITLIVQDLSDEQMLQYMGRENLEEYNTEFLLMLNAWEAGVQFLSAAERLQKSKPIDVARLLGWTSMHGLQREREQMTKTGKACANAYALIQGGYLNRDDLDGLTVSATTDIVTRAQSRMEAIEAMGKKTNRPKRETEQAKRHIAKGAKSTAKSVRAGEVPTNKVASQVDVEAHKAAAQSKTKNTPLFAVFGNALADQIRKMLSTDSAATKLEQIEKVVDQITLHEDAACLRAINFELNELGARAEYWEKRLTPSDKKIVKLVREA